jgi:uracil phosphoribosyltransferase/cytidylate kinase
MSLKLKDVQIVEQDKNFKKAFKVLRGGYPEKSFEQQIKGKKFREAAQIILKKIVETTLLEVDREKVTVVLPWRSAIAFGESFIEYGVKDFYHISSKRNEETLETEVDFEEGKLKRKNFAIISDPMLATGNTIVDSIERCIKKGIKEKNILVICVLAVEEGILKIKEKYPKAKIIIGQLDSHLDEKGYIVPGLGDFGDKYFSELPKIELEKMVDRFQLSTIGRHKLFNRIKNQGVSETLNSIIERDKKDENIDERNRKDLVKKGLKILKPKNTRIIDTGELEGIENVIKQIAKHIKKNTKIISIEGKSGVGKTSTTYFLSEKLKAQTFSMGDIFRYLTILSFRKHKIDRNLFMELNYKFVNEKIRLFHNDTNISHKYSKKMREKKIEKELPNIALKFQKQVIELCQKEITKLSKKTEGIIILEGRAFTLDFLPSDLRIKLIADPSIRAERRWQQ